MLEDHKSEADQIQAACYRRMTPAEKWQIFLQLRSSAILIKKAFLRQKFPDFSEIEIEKKVKEIFLYANS